MADDEEFMLAMFIAALIAAALWFVLNVPMPDYAPEYGSDPREIPYQMKD